MRVYKPSIFHLLKKKKANKDSSYILVCPDLLLCTLFSSPPCTQSKARACKASCYMQQHSAMYNNTVVCEAPSQQPGPTWQSYYCSQIDRITHASFYKEHICMKKEIFLFPCEVVRGEGKG